LFKYKSLFYSMAHARILADPSTDFVSKVFNLIVLIPHILCFMLTSFS
jgi:hypothetical protein